MYTGLAVGIVGQILAGQLRMGYIVTIQKVGNNRHVMAGQLETGISLISQSVEAAI
jgi:hypothetical protein